MANTGYKAWSTLEEYFTDTGDATGITKPNVDTDPDYVAPVYDTTMCPVADTTSPSSFTQSYESQTSDSISISWTQATDNVGVVQYNILAEQVGEPTPHMYSTSVNNSTFAHTLNGLVTDSTYDVTVSAEDAAGNITYASGTITVTLSSGLVAITLGGYDTTNPTSAYAKSTSSGTYYCENAIPQLGDVIYLNSNGTSPMDGRSHYHKILNTQRVALIDVNGVVQERYDADVPVSISPTSSSVGYGSTTIQLTITCPNGLYYFSPNAQWISGPSANGWDDSIITVYVDANTESTGRAGEFGVYSSAQISGYGDVLYITQDGDTSGTGGGGATTS
jgi:hypothetical protein